jgi:hypothetical protein
MIKILLIGYLILNQAFANVSFEKLRTNRFLTYDILSNIFGPEAKDILERKILSENNSFGGNCSLMEEVISNENNSPVNHSTLQYCRHGISESKTVPYSSDLKRRNALIINVCRKLSERNSYSMNYLLSSLGLYLELEDKFRAILGRFYPLEFFSDSSIESYLEPIEKEVESDKPKPFFSTLLPLVFEKDEWQYREYEILRKFSFIVCISERWQEL